MFVISEPKRTRSLTMAQMEQLHRLWTQESGVTLGEQIERAGGVLAETVPRLLNGTLTGKTIIVLVGAGNKGAGGLVAARHLLKKGAVVQLVLSVKATKLHPIAAEQYAKLQEKGLFAWGLSLSKKEMADIEPIAWMQADLIIDALLGTGIKDDPYGDSAELIRLVNATRRPILSFDLPSGLSGDEGYILSPCIQATATMTFTLPRLGLLEGWPVVRELWVANLGIPPMIYNQMGLQVENIFNGQSVVCLGPARTLKP